MTEPSITQLQVRVATATRTGIKEQNEDAVQAELPVSLHTLAYKGVVVAIADGVSSAEAGKEASYTTVNQFIEDYYKTPETWSVSHAGQKILSAINLALYKKSHEFVHEVKGYLCTSSTLIIKSTTAHFFHVGDSRIYRIRQGKIQQLTKDHVANLGGKQATLSRAVGMDNSLNIDYGKQQLQQGDFFLLTTDGLHDFVDLEKFAQQLDASQNLNRQIESLCKEAQETGSDDNISGALLYIESIPSETLDDYNAKLTRLPFPPPLEPGMIIDGYKVEKELFASSRSQLYLVTQQTSGQQMVMKTPSPNYEDDTGYIDRFIQEEWIGKRINNEHVVKIIEQQSQRHFLYYLMEKVEGISLDKWMEENPRPSPKKAISIIKHIAEGLKAFHEKETLHQDLKPANIMITPENQAVIVDFGSVFVAGIAEMFSPVQHEGVLGTATYSDPYYLLGHNPGLQGDIYSLATITYELFTGHLPYGKKINECTSRFDYDRLRYRSATTFNPIIPTWFDKALAKGANFDLQKRYTTLDDLLTDLTQPNPEFIRNAPMPEKDQGKLLFWQLLSGFWVMLIIMLIALFAKK